jgi:peptide/nickel transport system substrate-binding protein
MDRRSFMLGTAAGALMISANTLAWAQEAESEAPPMTDFPRNETLIVQNPEGLARNPGWFNLWATSGGGWSTGLHQLAFDTFWYIDPDAGLDGPIYNSLASGPPEYNADFTEMTVKLRSGILWSDGVEFTAEDVLYTVTAQQKFPTMIWSGVFSTQVAEVTAPDPYTVHFKLKAPNSRFHATFSVRWMGAWIMPKHIFEQHEDPTKFDYNPPLSLGPYTLHSFDPNGGWYIWQKREDWDKTAMAEYGEPGPKYVIYRGAIPVDKRFIEMANDNLDMIHDLTPEGMFALVKQDPSAKGWFPGFPYGHPDPTLVSVLMNTQKPMFQDKRVRWALALMLDAKAMSMSSYRGAATMSAIAVPPTGTQPQFYHAPMQEWITGYELDTGKSKVKPYDPTFGETMAGMLKPQFGDQIPTDPDAIKNAFGYGWWGQNPQAASELLESAGFTKNGNQWMMPDGQPFKFTLFIDSEGVLGRLGTMVAQNWSQNGVDVSTEVLPNGDMIAAGEYDTRIGWSIETWGGYPDLSFFLDSWHSQFLAQPGQRQPERNWQRWTDPRLDAIIEEIRKSDFNDEAKAVDFGQQFVKLMVDEMPIIPLMSFNVFSAYSEKHWTGFPNAERPYANIVNNWANSRYILTQLKPVTT